MTTDPHFYDSGVYHDTAPDWEIFPCCDKPSGDRVHLPRPADVICVCDHVLNGMRHYHSPTLGCPDEPTIPEVLP